MRTLYRYALGTFTLFMVFYLVPHFLVYELPYHRNLSARIALAERYFSKKGYLEAISLYADIIDEHTHYKQGRIRLAQAYFALSHFDKKCYILGLYYLTKETYKDSEIASIQAFLPERYREHFKAQFKRSK